MFPRFVVLFAILLHVFIASAHVTISAPAPKCKVASDCPKMGHDEYQCVNQKCVTIQHKRHAKHG